MSLRVETLRIHAHGSTAMGSGCMVEVTYNAHRKSKTGDVVWVNAEAALDADNACWKADQAQSQCLPQGKFVGFVLYHAVYLILYAEHIEETLFAIRQCCLLALETGEDATLTINF